MHAVVAAVFQQTEDEGHAVGGRQADTAAAEAFADVAVAHIDVLCAGVDDNFGDVLVIHHIVKVAAGGIAAEHGDKSRGGMQDAGTAGSHKIGFIGVHGGQNIHLGQCFHRLSIKNINTILINPFFILFSFKIKSTIYS